MNKILTLLLIAFAVAGLLLPHPRDFAPVVAVGLFSGAYLNRRGAWLVPVAALFIGSLVHGMYDLRVMAFVYLGIGMSGVIGRLFLAQEANRTVLRTAGASLASTLTFFLLSNFGCWVAGMFPRTMDGLAICYIRALPLVRNSLLGDLVYCGLLFGLAEAAGRITCRRDVEQGTISAY